MYCTLKAAFKKNIPERQYPLNKAYQVLKGQYETFPEKIRQFQARPGSDRLRFCSFLYTLFI